MGGQELTGKQSMTQRQAPVSELRTTIVEALYPTSANILPDVCEALGLASGNSNEAMSSKRSYVIRRLAKLKAEELAEIARRILTQEGRNHDLEEALSRYEEMGQRQVSLLIRRQVGRALNSFDLAGHHHVLEFLAEHFPIHTMPARFETPGTIADDLERYFHRNNDIDNDQVLDLIGAYTCSQSRFFRFLETLCHPGTRDEGEQERIVQTLNPLLARDGFALMPTGQVSGYPIYSVRQSGTPETTPADWEISATLSAFDENAVHAAWRKALERRGSDPDGAITAARTLLETVCKHIIEDAGGTYGEKDELPKLYATAAMHLNLAPSQHTEEAFRSILGNCQRIVETLGSLRNKLSDAHGKGRKAARPLPRHAELAVNLAGTTATFLVATWRARNSSQ